MTLSEAKLREWHEAFPDLHVPAPGSLILQSVKRTCD